jgi:hypothetical protein
MTTRITGRNSAVTGLEDIVGQSGTITVPTTARKHLITSASVNDDGDGLQITTAVVVGTIEAAGAGHAALIVTSALVAGNTVTMSVAVANNDTASIVATKFRAAMALEAEITDHYTIGGTDVNVSLTAKVAAANDATLNIAYADDDCAGLTDDATSNATHSGSAKTGARIIRVEGVLSTGLVATELLTMYGTDGVLTANSYLWINDMRVHTAGSTGSNVGAITATAQTDSTVSQYIVATENKAMNACYLAPGSLNKTIKRFSASTYNATAGAVTTVSFWTKAFGGVWIKECQVELSSSFPDFDDQDSGFFPEIGPLQFFKVMAQASAGTSLVNVSFDVE